MNAVVIGGGTNGLAAATALAKSGRKVVLFERALVLGGLAASEEFHPGFRSAGVMDWGAVDAAGTALGLSSIAAPALVGSFDGELVPLGAAGSKLAAFVDSVRPLLAAELGRLPPRIDPGAPIFPLLGRGFSVRRAGTAVVRDLLRVPLLSASDWLAELVDDVRLRGLIAAPGLVGSVLGPRQPTTASLVLHERLRGDRVVLGPAAVGALERAARTAGVELRTGAAVVQIRVRDGAVVGVRLADGTDIDASVVVACCDPRTALLDLLDPMDSPIALRRTAAGIRAKGAVAHVLFAVSGDVAFGDAAAAWLSPTLERLEHAANALKYRDAPPLAEPLGPLHVVVPSRLDAALAPAGSSVVSVRWTAAYPGTAWDASYRDRVGDAITRAIEAHIPGFAGRVAARRVRGPAELGVPHVFHADHAFDQLWMNRPAFGLLPGQVPIRGLHLGSAGAHPGGGFAGTSGWLAGQG